jgi:hypothetical protein
LSAAGVGNKVVAMKALLRLMSCCLLLATTHCASKDPAYETAMKEWADKACRCAGPANPATEACWADWRKTPEPEFPKHFLDAAMTNPNHEIASRYSDQVRACGTRK